jgi:hypothetical protein
MITDQFYWQQVFALERDQIKKAFGFGSVLWALIFIGFSILGMTLVHISGGIASTGYVFTDLVMMLAVVMMMVSTVMYSLSAVSSLWSTDMVSYDERETRAFMKYGRGEMLTAGEGRLVFEHDGESVQSARKALLVMALIGVVGGCLSSIFL